MNNPICNYTFTIVDTETTGLSPMKGDRLVEIGAIKIEPEMKLNLNNSFNTLINPEMPIPYSAFKIHGIDNDMVAKSPLIDKVMPEFNAFTKDTVIVAHNAKFDFKFIDHFNNKLQLQCDEICILDTLTLARKLFPEAGKHNLDSLINFFDIKVNVDASWRHRAVYDAAHTAILFQNIIQKLMIFNPEITLDELLNY